MVSIIGLQFGGWMVISVSIGLIWVFVGLIWVRVLVVLVVDSRGKVAI